MSTVKVPIQAAVTKFQNISENHPKDYCGIYYVEWCKDFKFSWAKNIETKNTSLCKEKTNITINMIKSSRMY